MSNGIELTRRRALGGLATIGVASAGAGAGTMALFSDRETSSGNSVRAGTLDLLLGNGPVWSTSVGANLAPGDRFSGTVDLTNDGTLPADHVEVAVSLSENDGDTTAPDGDGGDKSMKQTAQRLFVDEIVYPDTGDPASRNFFSPATQVPGAYVYDVDQDGDKNARVASASDPAGGGRDGVVHATSDGSSTQDYTRSIVDVSGKGLTLSDIASSSAGTRFAYDWFEGPNNEVHAPDEVKLLLENETGHHFVFQHLTDDPDHTEGAWQTRDVAQELDGTVTGNGWKEVDLRDGSVVDLGADLLDDYGSATLKQVGFGAGNFNLNNSRVTDIYYDRLVITDDEMDFRAWPMNLWDLRSSPLDNLVAPTANGGTETFTIGLQLDPAAGNGFQGDGVDVDFQFTLNQNATQ